MEKQECEPETKMPAVCGLMFKQIGEGLLKLEKQMSEQHIETRDAVSELTRRVQNGLSARIAEVETKIALFQQDRKIADQAKRDRQRHFSFWEASIASVVTIAVGGLALWIILHYIETTHEKTQQLIKQKGTP